MRVKKNKKEGTITYAFTGPIEKEIEYCEREIKKKTEELKIWQPVYEKMKHEVDSRKERIEHCKSFIELAKEELKKRQGENNTSEA